MQSEFVPGLRVFPNSRGNSRESRREIRDRVRKIDKIRRENFPSLPLKKLSTIDDNRGWRLAFFSFLDSCFPCLVTRVAALWGWHLTTRRFLFEPHTAILFSSRDTRSTKKDPDKRREKKERAEKECSGARVQCLNICIAHSFLPPV